MEKLPLELILNIYTYLDGISAWNLHNTCRRHRNLHRGNPKKIKSFFSFRIDFDDRHYCEYYVDFILPGKIISIGISRTGGADPVDSLKTFEKLSDIKKVHIPHRSGDLPFIKSLLECAASDFYYFSPENFIIQGTVSTEELELVSGLPKISNSLVLHCVIIEDDQMRRNAPGIRRGAIQMAPQTINKWECSLRTLLDTQSPKNFEFIRCRGEGLRLFNPVMEKSKLNQLTSVVLIRCKIDDPPVAPEKEADMEVFIANENVSDLELIDSFGFTWAHPVVKARVKSHFDCTVNLKRMCVTMRGKIADVAVELHEWNVRTEDVDRPMQYKDGILKKWRAVGVSGQAMLVTVRLNLEAQQVNTSGFGHSIIFEEKTGGWPDFSPT